MNAVMSQSHKEQPRQCKRAKPLNVVRTRGAYLKIKCTLRNHLFTNLDKLKPNSVEAMEWQLNCDFRDDNLV